MVTVVDRYPNAVTYVTNLIRKLCPEVQPPFVSFDGGSFRFKVKVNQGKEGVVSFSEERLEDFEEVVKTQDWSSYGMRFRYFIDFTIYCGLGKVGLITTEFRVSEAFLREDRKDWWKDKYVRISLDKELTQKIYNGLKRLESYLAENLKGIRKETAEIAEIKEHLERMKGILEYYKLHDGSLDESAASVKSLALLKASVISEIIHLEKQKEIGKKAPFALRAIDAEIYSLAEQLRGELFLEVPLPYWLDEYAKAQ